MTDPELQREILLDHGHHPRGEGLLEPCDLRTEGSNADTGDVVQLTLRLENDVIAAIGFTAQGSTVLRASCSMLVDSLTGKTRAEAAVLADRFMALLKQEVDDEGWDGLGDAVALCGIRQFPARVRCAILPWRTVAGLLAE
ncbi:Fe-S cluster assembly sulfur transfer protein SufU [Cerasicoccus fimbriatus]|uniref:Fe-S cluster assembly sulfur transfer protein SufU n=1 Tax=Cerasicoccus fimbriatus TaxID=3014554 RepID=UPI0022B3258B|nr:SUF system NifU family Fe-S cluster assembly protein [Cerasicoccus sp. TK19100]